MIKQFFFLIFLLPFLISCQISFYLEDLWGDDSIYGATELDKQLIFRHESLRKLYKKGELSEADGLRELNSVKYVLQVEGESLYITFFGTDTAEDVYYDLIHWKEPYWTDVDPRIRVHAGFNRPLQEVAPDILGEVNDFLSGSPADPKVYISGHSAGGIHAVLCTFYLAQNIPGADLDYYYCQIGGSPAPGNSTFAQNFDSDPRITCHRYINGSDMMPSLYTEEMGYFHVGQAYRIGPEPNPLMSVTALWLTHHFIGDYADSLR